MAQSIQTGPFLVFAIRIQPSYALLAVCKDKGAQCEGQPTASASHGHPYQGLQCGRMALLGATIPKVSVSLS
jgi:hypothetical protein